MKNRNIFLIILGILFTLFTSQSVAKAQDREIDGTASGQPFTLSWLLESSARIFECQTSKSGNNNGLLCCFILIF